MMTASLATLRPLAATEPLLLLATPEGCQALLGAVQHQADVAEEKQVGQQDRQQEDVKVEEPRRAKVGDCAVVLA